MKRCVKLIIQVGPNLHIKQSISYSFTLMQRLCLESLKKTGALGKKVLLSS
jgi:hypothetical protein